MWLVLCTSNDRPALWAANRLRARGLVPLVVLTPELLHFCFRWRHRLTTDHPPSTEFTLTDGRTIRSTDVRGVLNRLSAMPAHLVDQLAPADRAYALQEWTALHVSWLNALVAPVLNRPVMQGLGGAWRQPSEWTWLAARAGLKTTVFRQGVRALVSLSDLRPARRSGPSRIVYVVDGQPVGGELLEQTATACVRLAALAGTRLMGIDLEVGSDRFVAASPMPDLRWGGEPLLRALTVALGAHV